MNLNIGSTIGVKRYSYFVEMGHLLLVSVLIAKIKWKAILPFNEIHGVVKCFTWPYNSGVIFFKKRWMNSFSLQE